MTPETPTERAGAIVVRLTRGERLTTRQVMALTGLTRGAAYNLMIRLCRVDELPLTYYGRRWQLLRNVSGDDTLHE